MSLIENYISLADIHFSKLSVAICNTFCKKIEYKCLYLDPNTLH